MRDSSYFPTPISSRRNHKTITGFICSAGTDFLDIKTRSGRVVTVLRNQIKRIDWIDPDCGPCGDSAGECNGHRHSSCDCDQESSDVCTWGSELECESSCESESSSQCFKKHAPCCNAFGIPVCHDRFQLRLAGLTNQLNFQFFQFTGCEISVELL